MSNDLHTLSGAYALDALSAEEAQEFEKHLEHCPACRDEVRELQDAAARMGAGLAVTPSATLRARVLAAADQQPQLPPRVTPREVAHTRRWLPRLAAAAAAVVVAATGVTLVVRHEDAGRSPVANESVSQVFHAADARTASVPTSNGGRLRVATSAGAGRMAVDTRGLPKLDHRTYQMWAVRDGRSTSVGTIDDLRAGKVMPIPPAGTTVAITEEPEGGSAQPTQRPIITMDPRAV